MVTRLETVHNSVNRKEEVLVELIKLELFTQILAQTTSVFTLVF